MQRQSVHEAVAGDDNLKIIQRDLKESFNKGDETLFDRVVELATLHGEESGQEIDGIQLISLKDKATLAFANYSIKTAAAYIAELAGLRGSSKTRFVTSVDKPNSRAFNL